MPTEDERRIVWGLQKSFEQAARGKRKRSEKTLRKLAQPSKPVRVDAGTAALVPYLVKSAVADQEALAGRIAEVAKSVRAAQAKVEADRARVEREARKAGS